MKGTAIIFISLFFLMFSSLNAKAFDLKTNAFIENKGQIVDQSGHLCTDIKFIYYSNGFRVILRSNSFSYEVYSQEQNHDLLESGFLYKEGLHKERFSQFYINRVDVNFKGGNINPEILKEEILSGYRNFYNKKSPILFVHSFNRIVYKDIYPQIDIQFFIQNQQVKYDFILNPGANEDDIKIIYQGMDALQKDSLGKLNIIMPSGVITESIPLSYEKENRKKVYVEYKLRQNQVGFKIKAFNKRNTIIIDPVPVMTWGRFFGGPINDQGNDIATDSQDNIVVTGFTGSSNIATSGAYKTSSPIINDYDAFVAKFNSKGVLLWATYFGGDQPDIGTGIAIDSKDHILITGGTSSANLGSLGAYQTVNYSEDAFLSKFDSTGILLWATYYGGEKYDKAFGIAVDGKDNVLIAGETESNDGIASTGAFQMNGTNAGFLAKFNSDGNRLWSTYFGNYTSCKGIDSDNQDNIIVTGMTSSRTSIASSGAFQVNFGGGLTDAFIAKFDPSGSRLWSTYYGGKSSENNGSIFLGIEADSKNNIIVTGKTESSDNIATVNAFKTSVTLSDIYLAKFDSQGILIWGTYYGGENREEAGKVTIDSSDNIIFIGTTFSKYNIATSCAHQDSLCYFQNNNPNADAFIVKFSAAGKRLWATYHGNTTLDVGIGIITNKKNEVYITGFTGGLTTVYTNMLSPEFYTTVNGSSVFISKIDERTPIVPSIQAMGPVSFCQGDSVKLIVSSGKKYLWTTGDTTNSVVIKQEGIFYSTITDSLGCSIKSPSIDVSYIRPIVLASNSSKFCSGDNATLTSSKGVSYIWSTGEITQSILVTEEGLFNVTVKDTNGCVSTSQSMEVKEVFPPSVFIGTDTTLCVGDIKEINLNFPSASYLWSDGSNQSTFTITKQGIYSVDVTVAPCPSQSASINIKYISDFDFIIPNLISPNHDGINDFFEIFNLIPNTSLSIYNCWGGLIYKSKNYNNDWNAAEIPSGIYYYELSNLSNCVKDSKGWLEIIK